MRLQQEIFDVDAKPEAEFTAAAATDLITSAAHGLKVDDLIQVSTTDTLPAGLAASTNYYVIEVTTNTFKVSATKGGSSVNITDAGTGTHTFSLKGRVILTDGFEHLQLSLHTKNSANLTVKIQGSNSEDAPDFNAVQSPTNQWDYLDLVDLEDKSSIDGDTGIAPAGTDDNRLFAVNVDQMRWVTAVITSYTAGNIALSVKANNPY